MNSTKLFYRYWNALDECDRVADGMQPGAVRLALRLAIDDGIAMQAGTPSQPSTADRATEWQQAQISRLNEWLQVHEPGLYISPGDTADATLAALGIRDRRIAELHDDMDKLQTDVDAECADLQEELTSARNELVLLIEERDSLRQRLAQIDAGRDPQIAHDYEKEIADLNEQLAEMDADNSDLRNRVQQAQQEIDRLTRENGIAVATFNSLREPVATTNGNGVDPTTAPGWGRNHPAWDEMTDEQRVAIYELHSGRVKFGELSMELRTEILARVLRYTMDGAERMTMAQFDTRKPTWMPIASGLVRVFGGSWPKTLDLAATPA